MKVYKCFGDSVNSTLLNENIYMKFNKELRPVFIVKHLDINV
jgi:hypothetical protein